MARSGKEIERDGRDGVGPPRTKWYLVRATVLPEATEAAEFAFNQMDCLGTETNVLGEQVSSTAYVIGYFEEEPKEAAIHQAFGRAWKIFGTRGDPVFSFEHFPDQDWLETWKKSWQPTEVGSFIVAPPWFEIEARDKTLVRIEPGLAFGTGTHETTRLCLEAIDDNFSDGMSFLDVGTGTGVLTIAAALTGISEGPFLALDTDENSIRTARANAELNNVDRIDFGVGTIDSDTPRFDFVCANLTLDLVTPILPLLLRKTRVVLVVSGILEEQSSDFERLIAGEDVCNMQTKTLGEWLGYTIFAG